MVQSFQTIKRVLICFCILILGGFGRTYSTEIQKLGTPYVQSFYKTDYHAANQNWSMAVAPNGIIYAANADGLLRYTGASWSLHVLPNKEIIRSVKVHENGDIYVGGKGEFGFWRDQGLGKLSYHSLSGSLDIGQDEIWKIIIQGQKVIFQSFSGLYIYEKNQVKRLMEGSPYLFIHQVKERLFVELMPGGLHELIHEKLVPIKGKSELEHATVLSMLPASGDNILIGTAKSGLYLLDKEQGISKWNTEVDRALSQAQINNGLSLSDQYYAFGTILNGVFIVDKKGKLVQHIHKGNGLQNNTVLSIEKDKQDNLWVGLDNGIDRIEINSAFSYYKNTSKSIGTAYASIVYENRLYVGTNQGLYVSDWPVEGRFQPFNFDLVEGSQGQVWDLSIIEGQLYCGHNEGTYQVLGRQLKKLPSITGGWTFKKLPYHDHQLLQGTYTGIALFSSTAKGLEFVKRLSGYNDPTQYIEAINATSIWASGYKSLSQLTFNEPLNEILKVKTYGVKNGLPKGRDIHVFNVMGRTVFTTDSGFYQYDQVADVFHPYSSLNSKLGSFSTANKVISAQKNRYWFIKDGDLALVNFLNGGEVQVDSSSFRLIKGQMMKHYENIYPLRDHLYLINLDEGFVIYTQPTKEVATRALPRTLITDITNISNERNDGQAIYEPEARIAYAENSLRFNFSVPWYSAGEIKYQYFLEGYSKHWSDWTLSAQKEFTNLPHGDYVFKVRAVQAEGRTFEEAGYAFSILPPWYLSWIAWGIYAIVLCGSMMGIRRWYRYKVKKHKYKLAQDLLDHQNALMKKEKQDAEKRLDKIKNDQLQQELASKRRELANAAMSIVYKNELLSNVQEELLALKDEKEQSLSDPQLQKINRIIQDARSDERDWNLFESSFNEAHQNFFLKLKTSFPELVPNDLKLCAYLRMNMSSKEIAALLNITTRGVEIRRYRLRKKLNLSKETNLVEFLLAW